MTKTGQTIKMQDGTPFTYTTLATAKLGRKILTKARNLQATGLFIHDVNDYA